MKNPLGGLARRAGYATIWQRTYPNSAMLFLDTGNFTDNPTPEGELKTRALLQQMQRMGYLAAGVGERDLNRGFSYLEGLRDLVSFPFLSGNVLYQRKGGPVFEPFTVVRLSSKDYPALPEKTVKVGITSFIRFNPTFLKPLPDGDNIIIGNPLEEAKKIIPELRKQSDFVVVLASLSKDDARLLARTVEGIDLILSGYGGILSVQEEAEGRTRIIFLGNQGKYLAEVRALRSPRGWETTQKIHMLDRTYPEEPSMRDAVAAVLGDINERNRRLAEERMAQLQKSRSGSAAADQGETRDYLGSQTCAGCHPRENDIWLTSRHAHAFDILVKKNADFNPECVGCHVTGFRARGGFEDARNTPDLINVQCESCHGPGKTHPQDPRKPYGVAGGEVSCRPCHTATNSPGFDFASYWPKVKH